MTGPVTTEALVEARALIRHSLKVGAPGLSETAREAVLRSIMLKIEGKVLAPLLADLQRVTAEKRSACLDALAAQDQAAENDERARAAEARAAQLQAEVEAKDKRIAELSETWTDEGGTVWSPPTAWAYAKACAALNKHRADVEGLKGALTEIRDHPESYKDRQLSYAVGWAFFNVQRIARSALAALAARAATAREG